MKHIPYIRDLLRHMNKASDFIRWLRLEGDSLVASAELLGGRQWADRARAVVTVAQTGQDLAARRGEIRALYELLHLEFTTVVTSAEAKRFAAIHPDDPPHMSHGNALRRLAGGSGRSRRCASPELSA